MTFPAHDLEVIPAEVAERAQRAAAGSLVGRGLGVGDRVAIVAPSLQAGSTLPYLAAAIGALRRGIVPVLLNPQLTAAEQAELLADAAPHAVLRSSDLHGLLDGPEVELAEVPLARPMLFTSGTTGRPKGVYSGVLDDTEARLLVEEERDLWGFDADDRLLLVSPLHHSAPLRFTIGVLHAGGSLLVPGPFDPQRLVHAMTRHGEHRPTVAFMVPAHLQRIVEVAPDARFTSFRRLVHAGSPCPEPLKRAMFERLPVGTLWEFYGSTEGQFTACPPEVWLERPGTVGRARSGRRLEIDEQGRIWCHSPRHARFEYWGDPAKTAAAWSGDAFTVGDLGRIDDDGLLHLDGRRDDLIISGGVNVYPLEVEQHLHAHPSVRAAIVFGAADERWGQAVCAAVVGSASESELRDWLEDRVAPYKRPKRWFLLDELPIDTMGKVRRSLLADLLAEHH